MPSVGILSHGSREINAVRTSGAEDTTNLAMFLWNRSIHSRERIPGTTCMHLVERLIKECISNEEVKNILGKSEWPDQVYILEGKAHKREFASESYAVLPAVHMLGSGPGLVNLVISTAGCSAVGSVTLVAKEVWCFCLGIPRSRSR